MSVTDAPLVGVTHATGQSQTPHRRPMDVEALSIVTLRVCVCPRSFVAIAIRRRAVTLPQSARHGRSPPSSCRCGEKPLSRHTVAMWRPQVCRDQAAGFPASQENQNGITVEEE
jgi:hypothetical protein